MFSLSKKLFSFFAILQLIAFQINAETTSHISYIPAWTGVGIADGINHELDFVQKQAKDENKFFELLDISITLTQDWGYAYILYNLSDRMSETNPLMAQVDYVYGWTGSKIANDLQEKINTLQVLAFNENKSINFLNIKTLPEWGYAYIIYEISE